MDVFLTAEASNHYINRIHEITDEISSIRGDIGLATQITELNWSGESGEAALYVINRFDERFSGINGALSDAATLISSSVDVSEE